VAWTEREKGEVGRDVFDSGAVFRYVWDRELGGKEICSASAGFCQLSNRRRLELLQDWRADKTRCSERPSTPRIRKSVELTVFLFTRASTCRSRRIEGEIAVELALCCRLDGSIGGDAVLVLMGGVGCMYGEIGEGRGVCC
jgi:hypothetical protein